MLALLDDETGEYAVDNYNLRTEEGFGSSNYTGAVNELFYRFTDLTNNFVRFDVRGGSVAVENITAEIGDTITLPQYSGTKSDRTFIGWTEINYTEDPKNGGGEKFFPILYPGDSYTVTKNPTILYAAWAKDTARVKFCIQKQGIAKEEPSSYSAGDYWHFANTGFCGNSDYAENVVTRKELLVDYYYDTDYENTISRSLSREPNGEQIQAAVGAENFDPETQFVLWYVQKPSGDGSWHVDGVIRSKGTASLTISAINNITTYNGEPQGLNEEPQINISEGTTIYYSSDNRNWTKDRTSLKWTDVGTYTVYIKAENETYGTATATVKVQINKAPLTITAIDQSYNYDGQPKGENNSVYTDTDVILTKVEVSGLQGGDTLSKIQLNGQRTEAGSYDGAIVVAKNAQVAFNHTTNKRITDNYNVVYKNGKLTIKESLLDFSVSLSDETYKYDGSNQFLHNTASTDAKTGTTVIQYSKDQQTWTTDLSSLTWKDAGTYPIFVMATNPNYSNIATDSATLTITKRNVTLTSATDEKEYDGSALTNSEVSVSGDDFASGEGAVYDVTGSQTVAGSSPNSFTYTLNANTNSENYDISRVFGTLTVTNRNALYEITVEANSDTVTYNGLMHTVEGFVNEVTSDGRIKVEIGGNKYTITGLTAAASAKNRGNTEVAITGTPVVWDEVGNNVTEQFTVNLKSGSLLINPRPLTLESASLSRMYTGRPLTNANAKILGVEVLESGLLHEEGWVEGEGATYTFINSITLPGYLPNRFTIEYNNGTLAGNYDLNIKEGQLRITNRNPEYEVEVTVKSDEVTYDGKSHSVFGFVGQNEDGSIPVTIEGVTYYVWGLGAQVTKTDAGQYNVPVSGSYKVSDGPSLGTSNDVTTQFNVIINPGTLTILKRNVTLRSATLSKPYDGFPLTNADAASLNVYVNANGLSEESGWAENEGASYKFSGSVTLPGRTTVNDFTYSPIGSTKFSNYNITKETGTLSIENREARYTVEITVNHGEYTYNGETRTVSGFENEGENGIPVEVDGKTYYVSGLTAYASGKNVSDSKPAINAEGTAVVKDAEGNNVSSQFNVKVKPGYLTIKPVSVELKSATKTKRYDGKPLKNDGDPLEVETGFISGEGVVYTFTGSRTLVGWSWNTFDYTLKNGTKAENYDIHPSEGKLIVTDRDEDEKYEITVEANSSLDNVYDGLPHSASGFKTLSFERDGVTYTVEGLKASITATNAGTYTNTITGTAVVKNANGQDVTSQFKVNKVNGTLTITKAKLTVTADDGSKVYGE